MKLSFPFCKWNENDMFYKTFTYCTCAIVWGWHGLTNPSKLRGYALANWVSVLMGWILRDWGSCQKQQDKKLSISSIENEKVVKMRENRENGINKLYNLGDLRSDQNQLKKATTKQA